MKLERVDALDTSSPIGLFVYERPSGLIGDDHTYYNICYWRDGFDNLVDMNLWLTDYDSALREAKFINNKFYLDIGKPPIRSVNGYERI